MRIESDWSIEDQKFHSPQKKNEKKNVKTKLEEREQIKFVSIKKGIYLKIQMKNSIKVNKIF